MGSIASNLSQINARIKKLSATAQLIAASKFHTSEDIIIAIKAGQKTFGENRVQEAVEKWPAIKKSYPDIKLHLIGPLQSNKIKDALKIFDVIEVIDRPKLAELLLKEMQALGNFIDCYIQVNIGNETQKSGISHQIADDFIEKCIKDGLPIKGLMCIPPAGEEPSEYFLAMKALAKKHNLPNLSMGMSQDFETAIKCGATHVRIGTAIFGKRGELRT
jgi:pyridoxal phosphate enzyme (YggS family)